MEKKIKSKVIVDKIVSWNGGLNILSILGFLEAALHGDVALNSRLKGLSWISHMSEFPMNVIHMTNT